MLNVVKEDFKERVSSIPSPFAATTSAQLNVPWNLQRVQEGSFVKRHSNITMRLSIAALLVALASAQEICTSPNNVFTVKVNFFVSELGE
jgi:hypothetical protein